MSKLSEFIKLIPGAFQNADKIVDSLLNEVKMNFSLLPEDQQEEIVRRRIICRTCPLNSINALSSEEYKDITNHNYKTQRDDFHCSMCGCPISTRTASLESNCGIEYINNLEHKNIPLKWEKFK